MDEALYEIASLRHFAGLKLSEPIPDETTILNSRHMLEEYDLAEDILKQVNAYLARKGLLPKCGRVIDATIIAAPSSTKNEEGKREPEMHQTNKGSQWRFGMNAHIRVDADSDLAHTVTTSPPNGADMEQVAGVLHGKKNSITPIRAIGAHKAAWTATISNGSSPRDPATLPSCQRAERNLRGYGWTGAGRRYSSFTNAGTSKPAKRASHTCTMWTARTAASTLITPAIA